MHKSDVRTAKAISFLKFVPFLETKRLILEPSIFFYWVNIGNKIQINIQFKLDYQKMQTTATCKTTWTHKLEHKFAAKQLDSRINCMQKKNIWNTQKHTIWRSRLPEVLSTMLGLARTSKITGLSNQGIIKCVPSGYTCHDLFPSTLNEQMWNKILKGKKKFLLLLLLPFSRFPQNKKKRHHNCKRVDDWKKEATVPYPWRQRYDWRLWHDVLPPHCTSCSQLHTIRCLLWPPAWPAPPKGLQTEASRCACCC